MKILESAEDYLERILMLKNQNGTVRAIDIANDMNFSRPSVSIAMKKLRENGYIIVNPNETITLTEEGEKIANNVYERHQVLTNLFIDLGVSKEQALEDACKIEHDLSEESFMAIKNHIKQHHK